MSLTPFNLILSHVYPGNFFFLSFVNRTGTNAVLVLY